MGMKKSFAHMSGSRAGKKPIRNGIAKTSSWGCSKLCTQLPVCPAKLAGHSYAPAGV